MADPTVIAAVDLGSNTIKMTIAHCHADGRLEEVSWFSETVRLGRDLDRTGVLADDRMAAAEVCLLRFSDEARRQGASHLIGVATEAVRSAANGVQFLREMEIVTGCSLELIHGDREAALTFAGAAVDHDLSGTLVIADIGGASTEIIVAIDGGIAASASVPLGSGRLTDRHIVSDPPAEAELAAARSAARAMVQSDGRLSDLPSGEGVRLLLLGGTGEYLRALVPEDVVLTPASIDGVLELLTRLPSPTLAEQLDIQELRARVLPAGVAIAAALTDLLAPSSCEVGRSGIRTGLLLEACRSHS